MFKTNNIGKWLYHEFEPSERKTGKDFTNFTHNLKAEINAQIKEYGCELMVFSKGYFFVSGFVYNPANHKIMYFHVGDVRNTGAWHRKVLVREATSTKDYTGMQNQWTDLAGFGDAVKRILQVGYSLKASE